MNKVRPRNGTLFKYTKFSTRLLSQFINSELYFAKPEDLNDPHDCQLSISEAILEAVTIARSEARPDFTEKKMDILDRLLVEATEIEENIKNAGVSSFSKTSTNVLMWSHYGDQHKGLCIGFKFTDKFIAPSKTMIGAAECKYVLRNPFTKILLELQVTDLESSWKELYQAIVVWGLAAKHICWRYEKEVRLLRQHTGKETFFPSEVAEIIFGLNMKMQDRMTVLRLLSASEWSHVRFSKMIKNSGSFGLRKVPLSRHDFLLRFSIPLPE